MKKTKDKSTPGIPNHALLRSQSYSSSSRSTAAFPPVGALLCAPARARSSESHRTRQRYMYSREFSTKSPDLLPTPLFSTFLKALSPLATCHAVFPATINTKHDNSKEATNAQNGKKQNHAPIAALHLSLSGWQGEVGMQRNHQHMGANDSMIRPYTPSTLPHKVLFTSERDNDTRP